MPLPPPQNFIYGVIVVGLISQAILSRMTRFATADSWDFAAVTDRDIYSRYPEKFLWSSVLQNGTLTRNTATGNFTFQWHSAILLHANAAVNNRSMELSTAENFQGSLLAFCDHTGIVFEINMKEEAAFPKTVLRVGDTIKPYKSEWATVKDNVLYVGSSGKEWVDNGVTTHENLVWVKKITSDWRIESVNWKSVYSLMRANASATFPGYIIHEAVAYDPTHKQWLFLPRKISQKIPYDEVTDELQSANTLFILDEDRNKVVSTVSVGPLEKDWGFTEIKVLPKPLQKPGKPTLIMGIKVKEVNGVTESKVAVFDTEGHFYTDPIFTPLGGESLETTHLLKFEGLAFLEKQK